MFKSGLSALILAWVLPCGALSAGAKMDPLPVRGLHLAAPQLEDVPLVARFIRAALPKEDANTLVLEIGFRYEFVSDPTLRDEDPLTRQHVKELVQAARAAGVLLIPQINCLGHQSWKAKTNRLLTVHPEFDETPGLYPGNEGIYCRSYCPRHPGLRPVLFALLDELAEVFEATAFHVGMDEVFLLGEESCPRCKGTSKAKLFAEEVRVLHQHLKEKKLTMWLWGDRLIDGVVTGIGEWEASLNKTADAIDEIPRDLVICDWHYESAPPTAAFFALKGFDVVSSPWRRADVALAQLDLLRLGRTQSNKVVGPRFKGVLQTTWCDPGAFVRAYHNQQPEGGSDPERQASARQSADCFRQLFAAMRRLTGAE